MLRDIGSQATAAAAAAAAATLFDLYSDHAGAVTLA